MGKTAFVLNIAQYVAFHENMCTDCSCPYSRCEWHGKCRECVALHRYHAEHLPCCLQPLLREKITVLAGCCEMETTSRVKESEKFREYVKEQDAVRGKGRQI